MANVRKNLVVDPDRVRALAKRRGMSESAAVREAVELALGAEEAMDAIRGLHALGAFADFETLFPPLGDDADDELVAALTRDEETAATHPMP